MEQSPAQAACMRWHEVCLQGLDTLHPVFILMIFQSLMLRVRILNVMVWAPPEVDPETRTQGQLVSKQGFQEILVGE